MSSSLDTAAIKQRAARRGWVNLVVGPASMTAVALMVHAAFWMWAVQVSTFIVLFVILRLTGPKSFAVPSVFGLPARRRRDLLRRVRAGQPISEEELPLAREFVWQQRRIGLIAPIGLVAIGGVCTGMGMISDSTQLPSRSGPSSSLVLVLGLAAVATGLWYAWLYQRVIRRDDL